MPLFAQLLGPSFGELADTIQRVHDARPIKTLRGRCAIQRGNSVLARALARIAALPPAGNDVAVEVRIETGADGEIWTRNFGGHIMRSRLSTRAGLLRERLGPVTLSFALTAVEQRLQWRAVGADFLGVPLPKMCWSGAHASEFMQSNRYTFDVQASLPAVGLLVHYRGWLQEQQ
jgi:hypothetical protein